MRCCGLSKHGLRTIVVATIGLGLLCVLAAWGALRVSAVLWIVATMPAVVWLWTLWFFRDPDRTSPEGEHRFVSPADGIVADITPVGPDGRLGCEGVKIAVFMSVFDVHVNRSPLGGQVDRIEHKKGSFLDVRDPLASERNESTTIYLTHTCCDEEYPVVVRQIAGLLARRIVTDISEGQTLLRGQRIGMIKFGSRLEFILPSTLIGEIRVGVGDRVTAGQTVLVEAGWHRRERAAEETRDE